MEFELIIKKLDNRLSKEESIVFDQWYNESPRHRVYYIKVSKNYKKNFEGVDIEKGWSVLEKGIRQNKKKIHWKYLAAASVAILVSLSLWYNKDKSLQNKEMLHQPIVNQSIEIGSDKATLTLEDGSTIILEKNRGYQDKNLSSDGEQLVYTTKDGSNNAAELRIAYNYLTIPRGGEFFLQLSDGTKVWLNSDSKIKYPVAFIEGQSRTVELIYGEAYFDVSPSTNHKGATFKVNTQMQVVEVLGTVFNIKAYRDEDEIATTLVEGKVTIENGGQKKRLSPSEQYIYNSIDKETAIVSVDVYNEISWRKGFFSFKDKSLKEITKVLARWYDIDIIFENHEIEEIKFNGVLRKKQTIERILSIINNTNNIAYEIKDKKVILK
ncbi:MAG: DUF4974 domain-containing protein [Flavobacteriaceae bacterium]